MCWWIGFIQCSSRESSKTQAEVSQYVTWGAYISCAQCDVLSPLLWCLVIIPYLSNLTTLLSPPLQLMWSVSSQPFSRNCLQGSAKSTQRALSQGVVITDYSLTQSKLVFCSSLEGECCKTLFPLLLNLLLGFEFAPTYNVLGHFNPIIYINKF